MRQGGANLIARPRAQSCLATPLTMMHLCTQCTYCTPLTGGSTIILSETRRKPFLRTLCVSPISRIWVFFTVTDCLSTLSSCMYTLSQGTPFQILPVGNPPKISVSSYQANFDTFKSSKLSHRRPHNRL